MSQWRDLTADQVADLLEGGLDGNFDILDAPDIDEEAEDAEFLDKILQGLEGGADDPPDALDGLTEDDEDYWLPEGEIDNEDESQRLQRRGLASGRSSRSAQKQNASAPNKRKRSQERRKLAMAIRTGHLPARHIRSALHRGRQKLSVAQQRSQRVRDSFLLNPNEQSGTAEEGSTPGSQVSKPQVVHRTITYRQRVESLRNQANAARSDVAQEQDRLQMLLRKSSDSTRIEEQKELVKHAEATLTAANSELLTIQVKYTRRKLPAGMAYSFTEGNRTQGPFTAQQLIKLARQLSLADKTEVLVDSSLLNQGTMWVFLDVLLPLLEETRHLVNITPVADTRSGQPGRGGAKSRYQDSNGVGGDPKRGVTNGQDWRGQGTPAGPIEQWAPGNQQERVRFVDSGARLRVNSAHENAQQQKRLQQQKKYEEEQLALQEELTMELYTLETKDGDMWGPHSYEALASLVESKQIFEDVELMCDTEYGVSIISYVDLNQRMKERREKVLRLKQYANDAALHAAADKPANKRQKSPNENLQLQHGMPGPLPGAHDRGKPPGPTPAMPDTRVDEPQAPLHVPDRQLSVEAGPPDALPGPPLSMQANTAHNSSSLGPVNQPAGAPVHVNVQAPQAHAPNVQVKQEPVPMSLPGPLPPAPMGGSAAPAAFPGPPVAMPTTVPAPALALPVGVETVHAGAQPLEPPSAFNAVPHYAQSQPSGYGLTEAPVPGVVPGQPPGMPVPIEHVPQPPLPPQEPGSEDDEIEDIQFSSFKELMDHVRDNDMDHAYQVILERAGQQYPTRVAQLDVWALLAFKDAPLHIAEQALKHFVQDNHDPDKASEDFRALLGPYS